MRLSIHPIIKFSPLVAGLMVSLLVSGCDHNTDTPNEPAAQTTDGASSSTTANADTAATTTTTAPAAVKETPTADKAADTDAASENDTADTATSNVAPIKAAADKDKRSLITNPITPNTPEATLQEALDTLYYGDAKEAAKYYQVDMPNFTQELAKTQYAFQQTVEGVTLTDTKYNKDKTEAVIEGELMLKGQKDPAPLTYQMKKIDGEWKILG